MTTQHPISSKVGTNFAGERLSLGGYSSFADSGYGVFLFVLREIGWVGTTGVT
jgi:hypothetical protein